MITKQQLYTLKRAIAAHVQAQIALSWMGSQPVEDHPFIKAEAQLAKAKLNKLLEIVCEKQ